MQFYFSAETDVNTGKRWSEMDIEDLTTFFHVHPDEAPTP